MICYNVSMKKEKYAYVQYKEDYSSKLWIYKCDETFSANDIVEAPICNYSYNNIAIIKKIKFLTNKQLPVEKDKILTISTKLDKQKYEKFFHPLKYMKSLPTALLVDSQPRRAHYFATQSIVCYTLLNGCLFCFAFASKVFLSVMH